MASNHLRLFRFFFGAIGLFPLTLVAPFCYGGAPRERSVAVGEIAHSGADLADSLLKLEAFGIESAGSSSSRIEGRLLKAAAALRISEDEGERFRRSLSRLVEALCASEGGWAKELATCGGLIESEIRDAKRLLRGAQGAASGGKLVSDGSGDCVVLSTDFSASFLVVSMGLARGLRVGAPLVVRRSGREVALARVVAVRQEISGAVVQKLSFDNDRVAVGDVLTVSAQAAYTR
jgi:hypothetical protein